MMSFRFLTGGGGGGLACLTVAVAVAVAPAAHAQRAARDAAGEPLRAPTAAEAQALIAASPGSSKSAPKIGLLTGKVDPPPIRHADGTVEQELDDSTLVYTVARRNADGSISRVCVTGADGAKLAVKPDLRTARAARQEHSHEQK